MANVKGSKKVFGWLLGLLAMPLVTGCAVSLNKSIAMPKAPVAEARKVTVAVLPFETVEKAAEPSDDPEAAPPKKDYDENVRNFEKKYFAARLVETLAKSPYVKEAYVSPVISPSVDFVIKGGIIQSDGEDTKVTITFTRCCWKDADTDTFSIDLASKHFEQMPDPGSQLWIDPVNQLGSILEKMTPEELRSIEQERIAAYLEDSGKTKQSEATYVKARRVVNRAARLERTKLLSQFSNKNMEFAMPLAPTYAEWQRKSTKQFEEKRQKNLQTGLNILAAMTSFGAGMAGASMGIMTPSATLSSAVGLSVAGAMQNSREAKIIENSLSQETGSFGKEVEPLTIDLGSRVYTLTGSIENQLARFKQLVRSMVKSELNQDYAVVGRAGR